MIIHVLLFTVLVSWGGGQKEEATAKKSRMGLNKVHYSKKVGNN